MPFRHDFYRLIWHKHHYCMNSSLPPQSREPLGAASILSAMLMKTDVSLGAFLSALISAQSMDGARSGFHILSSAADIRATMLTNCCCCNGVLGLTSIIASNTGRASSSTVVRTVGCTPGYRFRRMVTTLPRHIRPTWAGETSHTLKLACSRVALQKKKALSNAHKSSKEESRRQRWTLELPVNELPWILLSWPRSLHSTA